MKGYVINLDRSRDRLATFMARAGERGIPFERIAAIDAQNLRSEEFDAWHAKCRLCLPMTRSEVACFLSHRAAWQRIAASQEPWAFIAEDDIVFSSNASDFLSSSDWLPADLDVVKAETMLSRIEMSGKALLRHQGHAVRMLKSNHNGAAGYFLSREGARLLLAFSEAHCEPADRILFHPSQAPSEGFRVGQMDPAICMQDFHLTPEIQREAVNTIGAIPRLAGRKKSRAPLARISRAMGRMGREIRHLGQTALHISVYRRVEMRP